MHPHNKALHLVFLPQVNIYRDENLNFETSDMSKPKSQIYDISQYLWASTWQGVDIIMKCYSIHCILKSIDQVPQLWIICIAIHIIDVLLKKFQWIISVYMKPINFQSKASVVCSVTTAIVIDFSWSN